MKKAFAILMALALVAGFGTVSFAVGISGTSHDMSGEGWNTAGEICNVCHTPHNPSPGGSVGAPLWNHTLTAETFTPYSSTTLDATDVAQPAGVSKLCLSCHDGVTGLDAFGGDTGVPTLMSGDFVVGTSLTNDHPVSFTYDAALATADGDLATPNSADWVDAGQTIPLFSGELECGSCHDVHDDAEGSFLRVSNSGSALCLTCHTK